MIIFFTGGGTLGSVTPLLAVLQELRKQPDARFVWVGTRNGPERRKLQLFPDVEFETLPVAKFDRFFSLRVLFAPFVFLAALLKSFFILLNYRPKIIVGAGAFTQVPLMWAGWILGVPCLIHQQDVRVGLANTLCARVAKVITMNFEVSAKYFPKEKTKIVGNPVFVPPQTNANVDANTREQDTQSVIARSPDNIGTTKQSQVYARYNGIASEDLAMTMGDKPLLVVIGGGTGAEQLNRLILLNAGELRKTFTIVLISGGRLVGRDAPWRVPTGVYITDFVDDTYHLLEKASLVVTRAGMGTLTELASLGKPTVIVPIPHSHQEDNARYFEEKGAAKVFWCDYDETEKQAGEFVAMVTDVWDNNDERDRLSRSIRGLFVESAKSDITNQILNNKL